MLGFPQLDL